jgi:hypothetical protein
MKYGFSMFPAHDAIDPAALARLAESAGFESLFFPDHSHIPASRLTPFPGGGRLGREYSHTLDLFVALTAAAAATTELRIGSGVCLLCNATDHLREGDREHRSPLRRALHLRRRGGPEQEEMANQHRPRTRFALLQERIEAPGDLTHDEASFTAASSTSMPSGRGRSPCGDRIRRSCSAARAESARPCARLRRRVGSAAGPGSLAHRGTRRRASGAPPVTVTVFRRHSMRAS